MTAAAGAPHSLRRRLLLLVLAAILLAALAQAMAAWRSALAQADEMFDYHLRQMALSMQGRMAQGPLGLDFSDESEFSVQIWGPDGTPLYRSARPALPPRAVLGFSDVQVQGHSYRVYSLQSPFHIIQIAQDLDARQARARSLALRAALPILGMAPVLMLLVGWLISRSFAPVERTRKLVARRSPTDLSPLPAEGLPAEVAPLVSELNALFGRVGAAFEAQQQFVADAAHELRSPLTALKLQAQALRGSAGSPDHEAAVQRLNQGIDRAAQLVEQLLVLARAEAPPQEQMAPVDLRGIVRLAVADALPRAAAAGIDLGVADHEEAPAAPVSGESESLRALVRNLLDNAIKYTPSPGRVDVGLRADAGRVVLTVDDSGPGIAPADRERVFDRFHRAGNAAAVPGTGLGLAIVKAVAGRHGARVRLLDSPLGGLRAEVDFPAA